MEAIAKGDQVLNVLTGELRLALRYLGEFIVVKDGQETLAWHLADVKNLSKKDESNPLPSPTMTTKLSQLIANDYLTPEKRKEISEAAKSMKQKINALKLEKNKIDDWLFFLNEEYRLLDEAFDNNDNDVIEGVLKARESVDFEAIDALIKKNNQ